MSIKPIGYVSNGTPEEVKADYLRTRQSLDAMCDKEYPGTSREFKLIVAGGRDYVNYEHLSRVLFAMADVEFADKEVSIVSGMARGADALGHLFAKTNGVRVYEFPANWDKYSKRAGFIRNQDMGNFSDGLLAFWDGKSRGTAHMVDYMNQLQKPVHIIRY